MNRKDRAEHINSEYVNPEHINSEYIKPWLYDDKPALVAHRGDALNYPENTLKALGAAVSAGAKYLEFDIQFSRDAVPFLLHDPTFERTAGRAERAIDLDIEDILSISVGESQRFGEQFVAEKPPKLSALCPWLNTLEDVHSFVEIKRHSIEHLGVTPVVNGVLDALSTLTAPHTVISFREDALFQVKAQSDVSVGWVIRHWNEASFEAIDALKPDYVFVNFEKIPQGVLLPQVGATWVLYDIKTAPEIEHCYRLGADLIETMAVAPMLASMR